MQDTGRKSFPGRRSPTEQKSETLFPRLRRAKAYSARISPPIIPERFIIHPRLTPPLSSLPIHPKIGRVHRSRTLHRTAKKPPNALKLAASDIPSSSDAHPASAEKPDDEADSAEKRSDDAGNERIPDYLILGEAYNCYIIVQLDDRLVFIDKHAAHERIIFDSLCDKMKKKNKHSQVLMFPIKVELTENELDAIGEYGDRIRSVGLEFSTVRNGVELTAIPEEISREASSDMIVSLASSLADGIGTVDSVGAEYFDARLYQASCKAAIKGGRVYSKENLRWICDRVLKVPAEGESAIKTCPHGRPVAFELKRNSIERQFRDCYNVHTY